MQEDMLMSFSTRLVLMGGAMYGYYFENGAYDVLSGNILLFKNNYNFRGQTDGIYLVYQLTIFVIF